MPTGFEDRLLVALLSEANSPAVRTTKAPLSRTVLPIAAATALLAAGGLSLASHDSGLAAAGKPHATVLQQVKPSIDLTNTNAVLAATTAAMDGSAYARVVTQHTESGQPDYTTEMWVEPDGYVRRMTYSENGALTSDTSFPADHDNGTARKVDYATKTYEEHTTDWYRVLTLTQFRAMLDQGAFAIVGQEELDGRKVTHLRETRAGVNSDAWVDSESFLPVKTTFSSDLMTDVSTWTWVSDSAAKPADLEAPIPAGFTKR